jgi:hypothetical protein
MNAVYLTLANLPQSCGECGHVPPEWPLAVMGARLFVACPHCHVTVAPVLAIDAQDQCE